jgi:drug/metabolite transporter (DMT)-like permease
VTGISFHLVAVFSALLAFLTLGERVRGFHLVGVALILTGLFLATSRASHARPTGIVRSNMCRDLGDSAS